MNFAYLAERTYRLGMNVLARIMRMMMNARGVDGHFCVGAGFSYYEHRGLRLIYNFSTFGVGGNIDSGGSAETQTLQALCQMLRPNIVFYDIGAHEGLFSLTVRQHEPTSIIHAFEPQPDALRRNIALNGFSVPIHGVAIGDKPGLATMTTSERSSNYIAPDSAEGVKITIVVLDEFVVAHQLAPPNIIKLDIEGFEFKALRGAQELLRNNRPIVITEINHCYYRYESDLNHFIDFMDTLGYEIYRLCDGKMQRIGSLKVEALPPSDDSNYWWFPKV